jgi:hypothetical protein
MRKDWALPSYPSRVYFVTSLLSSVSTIVAKIAAYTYGCYVNRLLGRPQGHIKELWA